MKAVELLRRRAGINKPAMLRVLKRIPSQAGLGGASSDAAAALVAANRLWKLGRSPQQLVALAAELGSDVPFFLTAGAAVCRGRGERLASLPNRRLHLVVVKPPVGLATPDVYQRCRPASQPQPLNEMEQAWRNGAPPAIGRALFNRLQEPAEKMCPWIGRLRQLFARQDCLGHQMSGSGTSYFGICRHARHARRVGAALRSRGIGRVFCATSSPTPRLRPLLASLA